MKTLRLTHYPFPSSHIIAFSKKQCCFTYGDILGLMQKRGREDCQEVCLRVTQTPPPIHLTSSYHNYIFFSIFHFLSSFSVKKRLPQCTHILHTPGTELTCVRGHPTGNTFYSYTGRLPDALATMDKLGCRLLPQTPTLLEHFPSFSIEELIRQLGLPLDRPHRLQHFKLLPRGQVRNVVVSCYSQYMQVQLTTGCVQPLGVH